MQHNKQHHVLAGRYSRMLNVNRACARPSARSIDAVSCVTWPPPPSFADTTTLPRVLSRNCACACIPGAAKGSSGPVAPPKVKWEKASGRFAKNARTARA